MNRNVLLDIFACPRPAHAGSPILRGRTGRSYYPRMDGVAVAIQSGATELADVSSQLL